LYEALRTNTPPHERILITDLIDRLSQAMGPLVAHFERESPIAFATLIGAHISAAEALAGKADLWQEDSAAILAPLVAEILAEDTLLPHRLPTDYPGFFEALLEGPVVRPAFGRHPRLFIWGALEARLHQADVIVLGGLNEGNWPAEPAGDPWMSRGMAEAAGLPPAEQRLGLAAHDLVQSASGAKTVYLTRAEKKDGAPAIASRWLVRLETLLDGLGLKALSEPQAPWLAWARMLDAPAKREPPLKEPRPTPPLAARPRNLSVTEIELWVRDPYAIYARHVLKLKPLDPLDEEADYALRGRIVHKIVEILAKPGFDAMAPDALPALLAYGREIFDAHRIGADLRALWWPRFEDSAAWLLGEEFKRRLSRETILAVETKGAIDFKGLAGPFTLRARADRIDRTADGFLIVSDYKTGQPPSDKEMRTGLAPQLPLEAVIASAGGFADVPAAPVSQLRVIRLMTAREGGQEKPIGAPDIAAANEEELRKLIARYDDPAYPYRAHLVPKFTRIKAVPGPYDHLARVAEWAQAEGGEDEL
jgi:ATP-dependent helicase/nuclease subunit B